MNRLDETINERPRRRDADTILCQIKTLLPLLVACGIGYSGFELLKYRTGITEGKVENAMERVSVIERKLDVHGQILSDIRDAVKDIAQRQRRRND